MPPPGPPEIAFAGRSNVGKSSLAQRADRPQDPGARPRIRRAGRSELNFFALGTRPQLRLVDMPGYGHAAAAKDKIAAWTRLMHDYLRGRATLKRVYVLIDGRHGLKPIDNEMLDLLDKAAVSYQVVLTKADEVKAADRGPRVANGRRSPSARPPSRKLFSPRPRPAPELPICAPRSPNCSPNIHRKVMHLHVSG